MKRPPMTDAPENRLFGPAIVTSDVVGKNPAVAVPVIVGSHATLRVAVRNRWWRSNIGVGAGDRAGVDALAGKCDRG